VQQLHAATRGLSGPKIPFDVRYRNNSLVFYRYGSFAPADPSGAGVTIRDPAGRLRRDVRDRAHAIPKWARDPFRTGTPKPARLRVAESIGIDLLPFKAVAQRGKGGVYEAVDLSISPPRLVIVKEGRRHGETDWRGYDGFARIQHEARALRLLRRRGLPVPAPLREFTERGNRYLVLEKVRGRPLLTKNRQKPREYSWRRAMSLLNQLGPLLQAIHRAGYVWRDCKPEHIFMSRGKISLIDFEGACRIPETGVLPWGSLNYLPPIYRKQFASRRSGTLEDDYAFGVILFQFLSGEFPAASAHGRAGFYKRTKCPDYLRLEIERLLKF
jgi:serine/threonine protein kinase